MRCLLHHPLQPQSRLIRLQLAEKRLDADFVVERPWDRRDELLMVNPAGEVPVLIEDDRTTLCGFNPVLEYLEEAYPDTAGIPLMGRTLQERAEVRRLIG